MALKFVRNRLNNYFSTAKSPYLGMKVIPVPLFTDNYAYLILGKKPENSILVDPAESKAILTFLNHFPDHKVSHVLFTHKHWDHVGDADVLLKELRAKGDVDVVGGDIDKINVVTNPVKEKLSFNINELKITCYPTPCHTLGALCYFFEDSTKLTEKNDKQLIKKSGTECVRSVFTGDTHFIGGCGKFFEGNAEMMLQNMDLLGSLPIDTFVFPGHEYTAGNLMWAMGIEWENAHYENKLNEVHKMIEAGDYSIPSTIEEEANINIFWRTRNPTIQERLGSKDPVEVMHKLRKLKDEKVSLKEKFEKGSL